MICFFTVLDYGANNTKHENIMYMQNNALMNESKRAGQIETKTKFLKLYNFVSNHACDAEAECNMIIKSGNSISCQDNAF